MPVNPNPPIHFPFLLPHSLSMPPADYASARSAPAAAARPRPEHAPFHVTVDGRPYLPNVKVEATSSATSSISVARAAVLVLLADRREREVPALEDKISQLTVTSITGGITNALFRVEGLKGVLVELPESVLVRVFGAEGMIDRDVECSTLASLCDAGVADEFLGRFSNGRVEGWLEGYRPLDKKDFHDPATSDGIAVQMAHLHARYRVPSHLTAHHNPARPAMWTQLHEWMRQALGYATFRTERDTARARALNLGQIETELTHLEESVVPADAAVAFCHNDLLAANIMRHPSTGHSQLIDFEYGGVNYASFDIANHFNEFAGGTTEEENGVPDYSLYPSTQRQEAFVRAYVRAAGAAVSAAEENERVESFLKEIRAFVLANHLYWGLWAVNQAAMEGCDGFDYLTYAENRFGEYYKGKELLAVASS